MTWICASHISISTFKNPPYAFRLLIAVLQQCTTLTSAKHSAVHQEPSFIPMDCIFCCLSRAFNHPAWYSVHLEGRSKTPFLGGMFSDVHLAQSMHPSSHVNGVQGEQKRIFGERHKCVCYFRVGIRCSQCTSLPILRKEEPVGLLRPVRLWKSGSEMHLWGPSCFYNCMNRDCLKPFAKTKIKP